MKLYEKIRDIDRRLIFLLIALAVAIPIIFQIPFPEITTPMVKKVFDQIDSMPAGSKVLLPFDYDPASEPELQPMANSLLRHLALRKCKLYFIALWPVGQNMIEDTITNVLKPEFPEYEYGVDYVNLGFKSGAEGVIKVIQTNLRKLYTTDGRGMAVDRIEMLTQSCQNKLAAPNLVFWLKRPDRYRKWIHIVQILPISAQARHESFVNLIVENCHSYYFMLRKTEEVN